MLVARRITRDLKGERRIPIIAGAQGPAGQVLHENPSWVDDTRDYASEDPPISTPVPLLGPQGSFAASYKNSGVAQMRKRLRRSKKPVTILAIGPATDVACLLATSRPSTTRKIAEIIWLASRVEGEHLTINGKVVNDFNFRMDPLAGAILLAEAGEQDVPVRLLSFALTGQTSQEENLIAFRRPDFVGPAKPTPRSEASLAWLLNASKARNAYWADIFGNEEGPFDQYVRRPPRRRSPPIAGHGPARRHDRHAGGRPAGAWNPKRGREPSLDPLERRRRPGLYRLRPRHKRLPRALPRALGSLHLVGAGHAVLDPSGSSAPLIGSPSTHSRRFAGLR